MILLPLRLAAALWRRLTAPRPERGAEAMLTEAQARQLAAWRHNEETAKADQATYGTLL